MMERKFRQQTFTVLLVIFAVCYTVIEKWSRIEMSGVRLRQEAHVACVRGRRCRRNNALAAAGEGVPPSRAWTRGWPWEHGRPVRRNEGRRADHERPWCVGRPGTASGAWALPSSQ